MAFIPAPTVIGLIFAPLASAMAFLITYSEYVHHYPDKRQPVKLATQAAVATLVFFVLLSLIAGFVLESMAGPKAL